MSYTNDIRPLKLEFDGGEVLRTLQFRDFPWQNLANDFR